MSPLYHIKYWNQDSLIKINVALYFHYYCRRFTGNYIVPNEPHFAHSCLCAISALFTCKWNMRNHHSFFNRNIRSHKCHCYYIHYELVEHVQWWRIQKAEGKKPGKYFSMWSGKWNLSVNVIKSSKWWNRSIVKFWSRQKFSFKTASSTTILSQSTVFHRHLFTMSEYKKRNKMKAICFPYPSIPSINAEVNRKTMSMAAYSFPSDSPFTSAKKPFSLNYCCTDENAAWGLVTAALFWYT